MFLLAAVAIAKVKVAAVVALAAVAPGATNNWECYLITQTSSSYNHLNTSFLLPLIFQK
jgi:6,7-dimethyl-8-ribityllumazine synthase